jgi:predicted outer membrane protein
MSLTRPSRTDARKGKDAVKRFLASLVFVLYMAAPGIAVAQPVGTLSPLDGELLTKVRLAGLWEMPAGDIAQERSRNPKVQEVGRTLMTDHATLDPEVRRVASLYNFQLPAEPNDMQKSWLTEMATASGAQFDSVWAMRLRSAHGTVFTLIAQVRASTTDPEIRKFATTANTIVLKHMSLLESTGMVEFPALSAPTPLTLKSDSEGLDMVVALTLVPLMVAITVFLLWLATSRHRRRNRSSSDDTRTRLFVEKELAR